MVNCGSRLSGRIWTLGIISLRGMIAAVKAIRTNLAPIHAVRMGIVNKSFDVFEKEIIEDVIATRIPSAWTRAEIFEG